MDFFATAAKGTEPALRDELRELRFRGVRADRGGVHFAGPFDDGARACIELRTAVRVLLELASFDAPDPGALYEGVRSLDWSRWLDASRTLAVRASCRSSALSHTQFISQKTKDAIVDQLRERKGARPSVDLGDPDVGIFVHLVGDRATLYLDLAGQPLHLRGYRARGGEAPLKETLAAAILRLSGWDRQRPLVDPMCGSATLPIEAALWASRVAPGLSRPRFGFERWASHDGEARRRMRELRSEARSKRLATGPTVLGFDSDPEAVALARECARLAGVSLTIEQRRIGELAPTAPPGFVVTNPPYGERLEAHAALYEEMASALLRLSGHTVCLLAGNRAIARAMPIRPSRALVVYNGPIECRLLVFDVP